MHTLVTKLAGYGDPREQAPLIAAHGRGQAPTMLHVNRTIQSASIRLIDDSGQTPGACLLPRPARNFTGQHCRTEQASGFPNARRNTKPLYTAYCIFHSLSAELSAQIGCNKIPAMRLHRGQAFAFVRSLVVNDPGQEKTLRLQLTGPLLCQFCPRKFCHGLLASALFGCRRQRLAFASSYVRARSPIPLKVLRGRLRRHIYDDRECTSHSGVPCNHANCSFLCSNSVIRFHRKGVAA